MAFYKNKEIVLGLIGLASAVLVAIITGMFQQYHYYKSAAIQAEREFKFQRTALDFSAFISDWTQTHTEIKALLESTPIDRFIMFRAWNGELDPKWTTNIFQMRLGAQEPIQYVHFELDDDYVDRLNYIIRNDFMHIKVSDIEDSAIKDVYEAEGIKSSLWFHIMSQDLENSGSVSHTYFSAASHEADVLDNATIIKWRILAGRLKGVAFSYKGDKEGIN